MTDSLMIDEFLAKLNRKGSLNPVSQSTKVTYRTSLEQFERYLKGRKPIPELAQEWLQHLLNKGGKPSAVAVRGFAIRRYFIDFLKERDVVILLPSVQSDTVPDYLELEELETLIKNAITPLEIALITVLADTALRISEFLVLTDDDVDWDGGFIFAHREKTKKEGWIPISQRSLSALKDYLDRRQKAGQWRPQAVQKLFPFEYSDIYYILKKLSKRAGMGTRLHPHLFRHTAAALRRIAGNEITDLADLLGHVRLETTRRYQHIKPAALKEKLKPVFTE